MNKARTVLFATLATICNACSTTNNNEEQTFTDDTPDVPFADIIAVPIPLDEDHTASTDGHMPLPGNSFMLGDPNLFNYHLSYDRTALPHRAVGAGDGLLLGMYRDDLYGGRALHLSPEYEPFFLNNLSGLPQTHLQRRYLQAWLQQNLEDTTFTYELSKYPRHGLTIDPDFHLAW